MTHHHVVSVTGYITQGKTDALRNSHSPLLRGICPNWFPQRATQRYTNLRSTLRAYSVTGSTTRTRLHTTSTSLSDSDTTPGVGTGDGIGDGPDTGPGTPGGMTDGGDPAGMALGGPAGIILMDLTGDPMAPGIPVAEDGYGSVPVPELKVPMQAGTAFPARKSVALPHTEADRQAPQSAATEAAATISVAEQVQVPEQAVHTTPYHPENA